MNHPTKDRLTISPSSSYDDNSENIDDLNKPTVKKQRNLVAFSKTRTVNHRNRNEFGISPVSLSSANNASSSNGREYETITSILAAAAYMGSGDASSIDSSLHHHNMESPASGDYSYAGVKERISNTDRYATTTGQSPDSLRSLPYGSNQRSPEELQNSVVFNTVPPSVNTANTTSFSSTSEPRHDSPASVDSSYASLKERIIASARKPILTEQSPDSLQSSIYGSLNGSPEDQGYVSSFFESALRHGNASVPFTSPCFSYESQVSKLQSSQSRNIESMAALKGTTSSISGKNYKSNMTLHRATTVEHVDYQIEPSPSAQTTQSLITTWSVEGISPTNAEVNPVDEDDIVNKTKATQSSNKLLVDDESSHDFDLLAFNSQETYEEIMMQDMRYPRVVEVTGKCDIQPPLIVDKSKNDKSKVKQPSPRELPPPSPRPSSRIMAWNEQILQTAFDKHSPLLLHEDSPLSLSIPLPQKSVSFVRDKFVQDDCDRHDTNLLKAVASPSISLTQLRLALSKHDSYQKDSLGRYPLHILSSNYELIFPLLQKNYHIKMRNKSMDDDPLKLDTHRMASMMKCNRFSEIAQLEDLIFDLLRLNPKALITPDSNGMIPFTAPLYDWIQRCNQSLDRRCFVSNNSSREFNKALDDSGLNIDGIHSHFPKDVEYGLSKATILANAERSLSSSTPSDDMSTRSNQTLLNQISMFNHRWYQGIKTPLRKNRFSEKSRMQDHTSDAAFGLKNETVLKSDEQSNCKFDNDPTLLVEWCLYILGRIMPHITNLNIDFDDKLHNLLVPFPSDPKGFKNKFVSIISSIPSLMKILILKTDGFASHADINCIPMFDVLLLADESIDNWIVFLLEDFDCRVASRGVNYLEYLSSRLNSPFSIESSQHSPLESHRVQCLNKISQLNFLLPATLSMENHDDIQRAVSTTAIQYCMDEELRKSFTLFIVFLDFAFRVLLIIAFQILSNDYVSHNIRNVSYITSFYICLSGIFYGLLRLLSRMISIIKISFGTYMKMIGGFYDWTERAAMAMTLITIIWIDKAQSPSTNNALQYLICITTFLLWARLLVWLFVVNHTATLFFRSLGKIVLDLRWLWMFLISVLMAFSHVFYISSSIQGLCVNKQGFCNPHEVYLQSYSILLGNFNTSKYQTAFTKFLFVFFTILVSILLLNVLIGMTVYSIQNTMKNASTLAINASRLCYVTDIRAFRRLFTTKWNLIKIMSLGLFVICSIFLFYTSSSSTRILIAKAFDKQVLLASIIALISIAVLSCIVFLAQISFIDPMEDYNSQKTEVSQGNASSRWFIRTALYPARMAILFLVGTSENLHSWWPPQSAKGKTSDEREMDSTYTIESIKENILQLQTTTNEKLDQLYDLLIKTQTCVTK